MSAHGEPHQLVIAGSMSPEATPDAQPRSPQRWDRRLSSGAAEWSSRCARC